MEMKRILLTLLSLSLLNIGLLVVILYQSSSWRGTYHTLIRYAIKRLQYLDYSTNNDVGATSMEQASKEKSFESEPKDDTAISNLNHPRPPAMYESNEEADISDDYDNNMNDINVAKTDRIVQVIKLQSQLPLNRFRKTLKRLRPLRKTHHSPKTVDVPEFGVSLSTESVTIRVKDSSRTFNISKDFTFPHFKCILRRNRQMAETPWIIDLAEIMSKTNEKTLFVITVNQGYRDTFLNWLITAVFKGGISLDRILVISLDQSIQEFLQGHGVACIYVPVKSLFHSLVSHYWIDEYGLVMFTRISVVRLLNHWGYSVVMIDTDALVLHDPQPLFDTYPSSSIVASSGTQPRTLYSVWNTTACNGLILLRSNLQMGK